MKASLFNSTSETAARLLIALPIINRPVNLDEITALDLVATYMKFFGYGNSNLHGDSEFTLAEFQARRIRVDADIKRLVRTGQVISNHQATSFSATPGTGQQQSLIGSDFANEYRSAITTLVKDGLIDEVVRRTTQAMKQ